MRFSSARLVWSVLALLTLVAGLEAQAPYGAVFVPTRETPLGVLYDSFHQCFYATVPGENSVYVISESSGAVLGKISIPSAFALNLSADGSRLYVTSNVTTLGLGSAEGYFIVDTSTLHVIDFVQPNDTNASSQYPNIIEGGATYNDPSFIAALSNGKVAYVATSHYQTGGEMFLNDPATNLATLVPVSFSSAGVLASSLDGTTVVTVTIDTAGENLNVYDSASGNTTANSRINATNSTDVAINRDGSQIMIGGTYVFDRNLNLTGTLPGGATTFAWASQGSTFSADGSRIYVTRTFGLSPVIAVYNASNLQLLGYLPVMTTQAGINIEAIAAGNSGKVLLVTTAGFLEVNASAPKALLATTIARGINSINPSSGLASTPAPTTLLGGGFTSPASVYFGSLPATSSTFVSGTALNAQPPPASNGVVAVSANFSDGWAVLTPNAYSYGPVVTFQDINAGDSAGGAVVKLLGHGLGSSTSFPQITLGGTPATVTAASSFGGNDTVTFTAPSGTPGLADIGITSAYGSTVLKGAFEYLNERLIPSIAPYQMIVDNARNRLYIADAGTGNVLAVDGSTLAVSTLFSSPPSPATALAMTPDGSTLLVASFFGQTLDLIDLGTGNHLKTIVPVPGNYPGTLEPNNVVATSRGTAILSFDDIAGAGQPALYEVDLATGYTKPFTTGPAFSIANSTLLAASADGNRVYATVDGSLGNDGGYLDLWQAAPDSSVGEIFFSGGIFQLATDDTGDLLLEDRYLVDTRLRQLTTSAVPSALTAERGLVAGEQMHSSGALAYVPTTIGVEVRDLHHGNVALSVGIPAGSRQTGDNLAINHAGNRLYVAQKNGIGVIDLAAAPLSIGSLSPSVGDAAGGTPVVLRGSGFVSGTQVMIDGQPASVQYVDSTRLLISTPAVSAAKDVVTVTNPGGSTYSLDAAFDATPQTTPAPPTLSSIVANAEPTLSNYEYLINGAGFVPGSVVSLNGIPFGSGYLNSTQLFTYLYNIPGPGQQAVTVTNPPNTTPSNTLYITTSNAAPHLNSVNPSYVPSGSGTFTLTAFGNRSLLPSTVMLWNGAALPTTYVSTDYVLARIPASLIVTPGTATITLQTPGFPTSNTAALTIGAPPLVITTPSLPAGTIGVPYPATTLAASGGIAPYSWSIVSGSLPQGLSLASTTGLISGTPVQSGIFAPIFQASDSQSIANTATVAFTLVIAPGMPMPGGLQFIPVTPCRVADTRGGAGPLGAGSTRTFNIPQSFCGIPSIAVAYSLNVTVVPGSVLSYLTMWPAGLAQPYVSTLNSDGRVKANAAITPAGTNGGVSVFVSDATNVILDIDGYFVPVGTAAALAFYPVTPCRVSDTRSAAGPLGGPSIVGNTHRDFPVQSSNCGIPANARAYSLNVTAIPHTTLNYLTAWSTGQAQPLVSTLNSSTGAITANAAIVPAASNGDVAIFVSDDADVILDVNGYFAAPSTSGLSLYTTTPCRIIDTRAAGAFNGVLTLGVQTSACAPPAAAQAYVLNATVVPSGPLNYLTLWPNGQAQPYVSTLNALDGAISSNMAIVPNLNGSIDVFSSDPTNVILDNSSYFGP